MKASDIRAAVEASKAKWPQKTVEVKPWGCSVLVRGMSLGDRCDYQHFIGKSDKNADLYRLKLLSITVCDEDGERLFPDNDGEEFGELPGSHLDDLTDVALDLSFRSDEELEEQEKNSQSGEANGS